MGATTTTPSGANGGSGRAADIKTQINLPWSKAIQIALNSLKIRFWRSLITAAGIFLGIAFLAFSFTSMQMDRGDAEAHNRQVWLLVMSFLVSTIGIMNSMLMSVSERFREIGTMKCLGALNSLIVRLFIIEAVFMGIIASLAGWALGFLGVVLVHVAQGTGSHVTLGLTLGSFGLCIIVGAFITLLAALLPALRAAQMPPAAALRTEV